MRASAVFIAVQTARESVLFVCCVMNDMKKINFNGTPWTGLVLILKREKALAFLRHILINAFCLSYEQMKLINKATAERLKTYLDGASQIFQIHQPEAT